MYKILGCEEKREEWGSQSLPNIDALDDDRTNEKTRYCEYLNKLSKYIRELMEVDGMFVIAAVSKAMAN
jgi:hypothetical protein